MNNPIYAKEHEKFVKAQVLYVNPNRILYFDEAFTKPVYGDELFDLYVKGMLIVYYNERYFKPYGCMKGEAFTVVYVGDEVAFSSGEAAEV